jgi:hypothetical protein
MGMTGTREAVRRISPVPAGARASRVADDTAPGTPSRRSASAISKVAWTPHSEMGQAEWLATGRRLGAIGRCSQWWIGDWIRYGTSRWGEKYSDAARVTGYDVASLRNMAWVASQFDLSLRSDKLTWSHHVLLAPLENEGKRYWLDRAAGERLSVADLRLELRGRQGGAKAEKGEEGHERAGEPDDLVVCPNCGHELHAAAE